MTDLIPTRYPLEILTPDPEFAELAGRAANAYSQFGEDGLIGATLESRSMMATGYPRWCFEVGAGNGIALSNVRRLILSGWSALLIEGDAAKYGQLLANSRQFLTVHCVRQWIEPESLDRLLAECGAPIDMALGVIDVDGPDYWIWEGLDVYRPRVMLVEYAYARPVDQRVADYPPSVPLGHMSQQAGRDQIIELGQRKGYTALAATPCNVLFIRSDLADRSDNAMRCPDPVRP